MECKACIQRNVQKKCEPVLIETLWNVKRTSRFVLRILRCINRNIVECKGTKLSNERGYKYSINRNIVECKEDFAIFQLKACFRINRNIVECKVDFALQFLPG